MRYRHNNWENGAALITALFITALTAILATAMSVGERLLIDRSHLIMQADKMAIILQGVEDWGVANLTAYEQKLQQEPNTPLPVMKFPAMNFEGAKIVGDVLDVQGRFNINTLEQTDHIPLFSKMIMAINPNINLNNSMIISAAISDWLLPGTNDSYYLAQKPPYLSGHQQMAHISEMRAVQGMTAELFQKLSPYLIAVPLSQDQGWNIDINNTSWPILLTLSDKIDVDQAKSLAACAQSQWFATIEEYNAQCTSRIIPGATLTKITTKSQFFLLRARAEMENQQYFLNSLLMVVKNQQNQFQKVIVVWRSLN